MKVLHVISSLSRGGGGPSRSAQGLVAGLNHAGLETWLMTLRHGDEPWIEGVMHFVNGEPFENVVARIKPDIVHLHGLWNYGLHRCAVISRRRRIPYVIAPRGMLEPWSLQQKWLKKRMARFLYQDRDLKSAAALHATAESEAEQFRKLGFKTPIIVSPNGVNVPVLGVRGQGAGVSGWGAEYRFRAQEKIDEWLDGLDEDRFVAVLDALLDEKLAAGEYHFKGNGGREQMREGAIRFFRQFSQKIVQLSDGRCVYFTPDERAKKRNADNAVSWAEYAVHAVTNGGKRLPDKTYNERWLNYHKIESFGLLEPTLQMERCFVRFNEDTRYDAIMFEGADILGRVVNVVTRLDEFGNIDANLTEVTFEASSKRNKKLPRLVPLTEAIGMVVHRQVAAGSNPSTADNVSYLRSNCKGVNEKKSHRVLFVSRMHPKKGVLELVEAFKKVVSGGVRECGSEGVKEWKVELVYTVSGELEREYEAKVKARVKELGLEDRFIFTGALNDDEKWKAYARADLFVLPTYSENFGIVVAEALWAGVPVITTKGTPWSELEGNTITHPLSNSSTSKCGKWIDLPTEGSNPTDWPALVSTLESMMSMPDDERRQMGENGRRLVEEKYTWDAVVRAMIEGYRNILK